MPYSFRFNPSSTKSVLLLAIVFLLVLWSSPSLAETGKPPEKAAAQRGERLYVQFCQSCHGKEGIGETPIPWSIRRPDYFPAPALDDSQHAWHHSDEALTNTILEGSRRTERMPGWKSLLTRENAIDLVAYIKSLWGERALACQGPKHMACMQ
jgi:mono/diheme cytochrome c family protein